MTARASTKSPGNGVEGFATSMMVEFSAAKVSAIHSLNEIARPLAQIDKLALENFGLPWEQFRARHRALRTPLFAGSAEFFDHTSSGILPIQMRESECAGLFCGSCSPLHPA